MDETYALLSAAETLIDSLELKRKTASDAVGTSTRDDTEALDSLKKRIQELESKLEESYHVNTRLTKVIEKLLSHSDAPVKGIEQVGVKFDLTRSRLDHLFSKAKRGQLWFSHRVPKDVEVIFDQLSHKQADAIKTTGRDSAFTLLECLELVHNEVRAVWEKQLPDTVRDSFSSKPFCYASSDDRASCSNGAYCEPCHYLVNIIHRLYNRSSNSFYKKVIKIDDDDGKLVQLTKVEGNSSSEISAKPLVIDEVDTKKNKWYDNALMTTTRGTLLLDEARKSVKKNSILTNQTMCYNVIEATIAKLKHKPKQEEVLGILASLVAMQELVISNKWKFEGKLQ